MDAGRRWSTAFTVMLAAGFLVTTPASAGSTWGDPQEVSSKFGARLTLSDNGRVAAWVRTNKTDWAATGPVRTARFAGAKKGWTSSAPIPGASGSTEVQLSGAGDQALITVPGTGYLMSQRERGNTWSTATAVVSGTDLENGFLGAGNTVVYIDWGPDADPAPAGTLYRVTRNADGTWPAPTPLGSVDPAGRDYYVLDFSKDGSTVVWVSDSFALMGATRNDDGSWSPPTVIAQYPESPGLEVLETSARGTKVMWAKIAGDGLLLSSRTGTTWTPATTLTVDTVDFGAISPDGRTIAWGQYRGDLMVSRWNGVKWLKATSLGATVRPSIAVSNRTLAWNSRWYRGSTLRSAIYKGGRWRKVVRHSSTGFSPAVSEDGMTLAWSSTGNKRIFSVTR